MNRHVILLLYFAVVTGQQCTDKCYLPVQNGLKNLEELYDKPPLVSNIQPIFDNISSLINRTENIILSINIPEDVKNKSLSSYDIISNSSKKLKLIKNILDQIDLINEQLDELQQKKDKHKDAFNTCDEANELYARLRDDVRQIAETGDNLNKTFEGTSKHIDEIKEQSQNIKNDLDAVIIPDNLFRNYLCNSRLRATVQDIINTAERIANSLKTLLAEIIDSKLNDLNKNITEHERNIEEIQKDLSEKLPEPDLTATDQTKSTLEGLREQVADLKNKIKQIALDKSFEDILEDVNKKMRVLINEYEKILNQVFSADTRDKVKEEIEKAKETLRLLKERNAVKAELADIRKVVNMLQDRGICFINETVSVEDKI